MRVTSAQDPLKVLLVEDSKGDALIIKNAFKATGAGEYNIECVTTLDEALKILSEEAFDVALLDRSLPDADGFDGLHSIQNLSPHLPVIFLTAYQDEATACESIQQGAQDYLYKDQIDGHIITRAIQYAIIRKQFEGIFVMRANYDALTKLANRMLFESRLKLACEKVKRLTSNEFSLLFLDLDGFKAINDTYGHAAGDELLKEVGTRLQKSLRPYDTAARFGGDEFAILLEELPDSRHYEIIAKKIIQLFAQPFALSGKELHVGVSIGVTTCTGSNAADFDTLLEQADMAMYTAKSTPNSSWVLYDKSMAPAKKKSKTISKN